MTRKNTGGLSDDIVLKEEKEVIFYLHNPYPDCLGIPTIIKQRFPYDFKSIVVSSLDEFYKYGRKHEKAISKIEKSSIKYHFQEKISQNISMHIRLLNLLP